MFSTPQNMIFPESASVKWLYSQNTRFYKNGFEAKTILKTPQNRFDSLSVYEPSWEITFDLEKSAAFPLIIKTGILSPSGSISRLNQPSLSANFSCFSDFSSPCKKLSALCKTPSSKESLFASFYEFKYKSFSPLKLKIENAIYAFENGDSLTSFYIYLPASNNRDFSAAFSQVSAVKTFSNTNQSWFSFADYFPSSKFYSVSNQFSLRSSFFGGKCFFNLYESRNTYPDWTFSAEGTFSLKNFSLSASYFRSSTPYLFTSSGKNLKTVREFFFNPHCLFYLKNLARIRLGSGIFLEDNFDSKGNLLTTAKLTYSIEIKTKSFLIKTDASVKNISIEENCFPFFEKSEFTGKLSINYLNAPSFKTTFTVNSNFSEENSPPDLKIKSAFQIGFKTRIPFSANASFSIKNDGVNVSLDEIALALNAKVVFKNLTFSFFGKFTIL